MKKKKHLVAGGFIIAHFNIPICTSAQVERALRWPLCDDNAISCARNAAESSAAFLRELNLLSAAAGYSPGLLYQELLRRPSAPPTPDGEFCHKISAFLGGEAAEAIDRAGPAAAAALVARASLLADFLRIRVHDTAGLAVAAGCLPAHTR